MRHGHQSLKYLILREQGHQNLKDRSLRRQGYQSLKNRLQPEHGYKGHRFTNIRKTGYDWNMVTTATSLTKFDTWVLKLLNTLAWLHTPRTSQ